jgi:threonine/homoserine/homoserine lactone efflux protein
MAIKRKNTMIEPSKLYLFMGAALILLLVPGPAVLYITARSASQGRLAGLVSVLAIETANFVQAVAAALGLSAIVLSSALAFNVVKYLGAAYLIYLGIRKLLASDNGTEDETVKQERLSRIYWQGFAVNILNPKTALFFFAFLPQFVDPTKGNVIEQNLMLGAVFVGMAIITDSIYALLTSSIAGRLSNNRRFQKGGRYFAGLVYIGLGITTALAGAKK